MEPILCFIVPTHKYPSLLKLVYILGQVSANVAHVISERFSFAFDADSWYQNQFCSDSVFIFDLQLRMSSR